MALSLVPSLSIFAVERLDEDQKEEAKTIYESVMNDSVSYSNLDERSKTLFRHYVFECNGRIEEDSVQSFYYMCNQLGLFLKGQGDVLTDQNLKIKEYCKRKIESGVLPVSFITFLSDEEMSDLLGTLPDSAFKMFNKNDVDNLFSSTLSLAEDSKNIVFSNNLISEMKEILQQYLVDTQPYYIKEGKGSNCWFASIENNRLNPGLIKQLNDFIKEKIGDKGNATINTWNSARDYGGYYNGDQVFISDFEFYAITEQSYKSGSGSMGDSYYFVLADGSKLDSRNFKTNFYETRTLSPLSNSGYNFGVNFFPTYSYCQLYRDIIVFKSRIAFNDYMLNGATYYTGSVFNGDIKNVNKTVNYNTYVNTDWQQVNQDTFDQIKDAINNQGDNVSKDEINKIVDSATDDIVDAIKDGSKTTNELLKEIKNTLQNAFGVKDNGSNWFSAQIRHIRQSLDSIASTLKKIDDCLGASEGVHLVTLFAEQRNYIQEFQASMVSNASIITEQLKACNSLLNDIRDLSIPDTVGTVYAQLSDEQMKVLEEIADSQDKEITIDRYIFERIFGYSPEQEGELVHVDGDNLYSILSSIKNNTSTSNNVLDKILLEIQQLRKEYNLSDQEESDGLVDSVLKQISPLTDKLKEKFPFSAPWDLFNLVNVLCADPVAPVFNVQMGSMFATYDQKRQEDGNNVIYYDEAVSGSSVKADGSSTMNVSGSGVQTSLGGQFKIKGSYTIDFEKYNDVRKVGQAFLDVIFVAILIVWTRKLFLGKGDS